MEMIKQKDGTSCLAACIETALKEEGLSEDQKIIHEAIMIPKNIAPTRFSLMELAALYLKEKLPNYEVHLYSSGRIISDRVDEFTGLSYLKAIEEIPKDTRSTDPDVLNSFKASQLARAKEAGVIVHENGITKNELTDSVGGGNIIILGINTAPVLDYFGVDHPPYNHAIMPTEVSDGNMSFGEPARGTPEEPLPKIMTLPRNIIYESMAANGKNFLSGNTEAIILIPTNSF